MADSDPLKAALLRLAAGNATDAELEIVQRALQNDQIILATGEQAVAVGGNVNDAVIVTGDENVVLVIQGLNAETLRTAIEQIRMPKGFAGSLNIPRFVPSLPYHFVERKELEKLRDLLLSTTERHVGIVGMSGVGKTIMAIALARSPRISQAFPGGIYWISRNWESNLNDNEISAIPYQRQLFWQMHHSSLEDLKASTWREGLLQLQRLATAQIESKHCLIVLDDPPETVANLLTALDIGENATFLVTTQNKEMLYSKGVRDNYICELRTLGDEEARKLLSLWAFDGANRTMLPQAAQEVAAKCENHPLALAMIGAIIRGEIDQNTAWKDILETLKEGTLQDISYPVDNYSERFLPLVFEKSLQALDKEIRECFTNLALFPPTWNIALTDLYRIWESYTDRQVRRMVRVLTDKSVLLRIDQEHFNIHSLMRLHIRRRVSRLDLLYQQIAPKILDGFLPLCLAVQWEDEEAVRSMVTAGYDVNETQSNGSTALHIAAERGLVGLVSMLANAKADINRTFSSSTAAIHLAAIHGHIEVERILIECGAAIDQQDSEGFSALQYAAQKGHIEVVSLLLEKGANVELQNTGGKTALYVAAYHGHAAIVRILLQKQPQVEQQTDPTETPLRFAAARGHIEVVRALLNAGVDVNWANPEDGGTALHLAVQNGHLDIVCELAERGSVINQRSIYGHTALHAAAISGRSDIIQLLIEKGAEVDCEERNGFTALHFASSEGNVNIVRALIEARVAIDRQTHDGWTALHMAALTWELRIIDLLLASGANVNQITNTGWTALHLAASQNRILKLLQTKQQTKLSIGAEGIRFASAMAAEAINGAAVIYALIRAGASVEARTAQGQTSLHLAICSGDITCVEALLNVTNDEGNTALDLAKKQKREDVIKLIQDRFG